MRNDIEHAFAALAEEAGRVRQADAASVRRAADRGRAARAAVAVGAVAVLVTGVTVASGTVFGRQGGPAPAASVPPTASVPATPGSTRPPIPAEIPDRAFLQASDVPGRLNGPPIRTAGDDQKLIQFCGETYDRPNQVGVRAARQYPVHPADPAAGSALSTFLQQDVIVYRDGGAEEFMYLLAEAVKYCPTAKDPSGVRVAFRQLGPIGAGDESMLIERTRAVAGVGGKPTGAGDASPLYWAAVRVGDTVAFVSNLGWQAQAADRDATVELGRRAAARLRAWRG